MIAKKVHRTSSSDFGRLAKYIGASDGKVDKLHSLWVSCCAGQDGCNTIVREGHALQEGITDTGECAETALPGDNPTFQNAIAEIEMTQAANKRARSDKTYHLILSFREREGNWPDIDTLQKIESEFIEALGFAGHQRICATHTDTDNFHMHLAINKVNPTNLRCITPHRDYKKLERACRQCERKFGLEIDRGRQERTRDQFISTIKEVIPALQAAIKQAGDWQHIHDLAAKRGVAICRKGAGLAFVNIEGNRWHEVKASKVAREFSLASLEKMLGKFKPDGRARASIEHSERKDDAKEIRRRTIFRQRVKGIAGELVTITNQASSWREVHAEFAERELRLARKGSGFVITDSARTVDVAASTIDLRLSKSRLETGLGRFEASQPSTAPHPDRIDQLSPGARDYEAASWEVSFERYVKSLRGKIDSFIARAIGWNDVHDGFASLGLRIRLQNNGLVITDITGRHRMKASSLHRNCSKMRMEQRLGTFERDKNAARRRADRAGGYRRMPTTRHPRQKVLWNQYIKMAATGAGLSISAKQGWRVFLEEHGELDQLARAIIRNQEDVAMGFGL